MSIVVELLKNEISNMEDNITVAKSADMDGLEWLRWGMNRDCLKQGKPFMD